MGSVMVALIWLYDTIVNDTSFRPSTRVSERCDLWLYIVIHLSPSGSIDYSSTSIRCTYCRSCHYRVSYRYRLGCVSCLDKHLLWLAYVENFLGGMTIMSVAAVDPQHHIAWTMPLAASEPHRNTIYPAFGHDTPSHSQSVLFAALLSDTNGRYLFVL